MKIPGGRVGVDLGTAVCFTARGHFVRPAPRLVSQVLSPVEQALPARGAIVRVSWGAGDLDVDEAGSIVYPAEYVYDIHELVHDGGHTYIDSDRIITRHPKALLRFHAVVRMVTHETTCRYVHLNAGPWHINRDRCASPPAALIPYDMWVDSTGRIVWSQFPGVREPRDPPTGMSANHI